jgi:hypothetical protein
MKKLTILLLCVVCVAFVSVTLAQKADPPKTDAKAAGPATKEEAKKEEPKTEMKKEEPKAMEPAGATKLGEPVKIEGLIPLEKLMTELDKMAGKDVVTEGIVVEVEAKGAWIKIGEKEKLQVTAVKFVFPADAKGMKAIVGGKVEGKMINATGAELVKVEAKVEPPKTEMKAEPKTEMKAEPKKDEPKKDEPKTK